MNEHKSVMNRKRQASIGPRICERNIQALQILIVLALVSLAPLSESFSRVDITRSPRPKYSKKWTLGAQPNPESSNPQYNRRIRKDKNSHQSTTKVATKHTDENNQEKFLALKHDTLELVKENSFRRALRGINEMTNLLELESDGHDRLSSSRDVDDVLQAFTNRAFLPPYRGSGAQRRIKLGMDAVTLQLSSNLSSPYDTVQKRVLLNALRALTGLNEVKQPGGYNSSGSSSVLGFDSSLAAFRILQRLVTGVGIRRKSQRTTQYSNSNIQEKDFNMVLNSFSSTGRMDMAHKTVALQERTKAAPLLSPVPYSILLKGYGRLGDLRNVATLVSHAEANGIRPDTVMINSLIDAYINCNALAQAKEIFDYLTTDSQAPTDDKLLLQWLGDNPEAVPKPNKRTYNTMLKGLANSGALEECISLSHDMHRKGIWDDVTTNTLVHGALLKGNFTLAEDILQRFTSSAANDATNDNSNRPQGWHPNVEAYTELLDGYAKSGNLDKSLEVLQTMKARKVSPNEITYTCLIGAFARRKDVEQAQKMLTYMKAAVGLKPTVISYNAFISGLVSGAEPSQLVKNSGRRKLPAPTGEHVDEAMKVYYEMMRDGILPNDVTISTLVLALGRCRSASRASEAKELVHKLESGGIGSFASNGKVATALIQACGIAGDIKGALAAFRGLKRPDLVAVNAFLDACGRCSNDQLALKTFRHFFGTDQDFSSSILNPDVISYSIMITSLVKKNTADASSLAQKLYDEMTKLRNIFPDKAMVDL